MAGSWITIYDFSTGDAEEGVRDATVCTLSRKVRVISFSTWTLFIVIVGITVYPALDKSNALVKQTNVVVFED